MKNLRTNLIYLLLIFTAVVTLSGCFIDMEPLPEEVIDGEDAEKYLSTFLAIPKDKTPDEFTANENIYIAQQKLMETKYYKTSVTGSVLAKVAFINYNQIVFNQKIINDNEAFSEAISISSLKKVADQRYIISDNYITRKADKVRSQTNVTWAEDATCYTRDDYFKTYGGFIRGLTNYIINDYTIKSSEMKLLEDGAYSICFDIDTIIGPTYYKREVKKMSDTTDYPTFNAISMKLIIDDAWTVKEFSINENYNLPLFGGITCNGNLTEIYEYQDSPFDLVERDFFNKFIDKGPSDIIMSPNHEKPADYLTMAFQDYLFDNKTLSLEGKLLINKKEHFVKLSVNVQDKRLLFVLDDRVSFIYIENNLYFKYNNEVIGINNEQLKELITHILPENSLENLSLQELLENEQLANLIDSMELVKNENKIGIVLDSSNKKIVINLTNDNKINLQEIEIEIQHKEKEFKLNLSPIEEIIDCQIPTDFEQITNISLITDYINILKNNKSWQINSAPINIDIYGINGTLEFVFNLSYEETLIIYGESIVTLNNQKLNMFYYINSEGIYLTNNENLNISLSFQDIKNLLANLDYNFDEKSNKIMEIISSLRSFDFNIYDVLKDISISNQQIDLKICLSEFGIDENVNISLTKDLVTLNNDFLTVNITPSSNEASFDILENTISYEDINRLLLQLKKLGQVKKIGGSLFYNTVINEKDLYLNIDYQASFDKELYLDMNISFELEQYKGLVNIIYKDNFFYIEFGNACVKLSYEEGKHVYRKIINDFNLEPFFQTDEKDINQVLSLIDYNEILNSLCINNNIEFTIDLDKISSSLGKLTFKFWEDEDSISDTGINTINIYILDEITKKEPAGSLNYCDTLNLINNSNLLLKYINKQEYSFNFTSTVFNNEIIRFIIDGSLYYNNFDNNKTLKIELNIKGESDHTVLLTYVDKQLYIVYNGFKMQIDVLSFAQCMRYSMDFLMINIPIINDVINSVTEGIEENVFENYFTQVAFNIDNVFDLLHDININNEQMEVILNNSIIYPFATSNNTSVSFDNDFNNITFMSLNNIYSSENEYFNIDMDLNQNSVNILKPEDADAYMDFSSLDNFLNSFFKTAGLKNYHIIGSVSFKVLGINYPANVPVDIEITLDEKYRPTIMGTLNVPYVIGVTNAATKTSLYYKDQVIYVKREYRKPFTFKTITDYKKYDEDDYSKEIVKNLAYLCNFTNSITDKIIGSSNSDHKIRFEKVLKNYGLNNEQQYLIIVDGTELSGDENIGDVTLNIYEGNEKFLTDIMIKANFLNSFLSLQGDFHLIDLGQKIEIIEPSDLNKYNY